MRKRNGTGATESKSNNSCNTTVAVSFCYRLYTLAPAFNSIELCSSGFLATVKCKEMLNGMKGYKPKVIYPANPPDCSFRAMVNINQSCIITL